MRDKLDAYRTMWDTLPMRRGASKKIDAAIAR